MRFELHMRKYSENIKATFFIDGLFIENNKTIAYENTRLKLLKDLEI